MLDVSKMVDAVLDAIDKPLSALAGRIKALEGREPIKGEKGDAGTDGSAGRDGIDGKDGTPGRDGEKGIDGLQGKDGADGKEGPAGPAGKDGEPGKDGRDGQPGAQGTAGRDGKDGSDGLNGKDGADGLGFDDLTVEFDGERTAVLRFARGDVVKEFPIKFPIVLDRGVWKEGVYEQSDGVTWGGSWFVARKDNPAGKPGESDDWRLAVKRGRDGKDGKPGEKGIDGAPGKDFRPH